MNMLPRKLRAVLIAVMVVSLLVLVADIILIFNWRHT